MQHSHDLRVKVQLPVGVPVLGRQHDYLSTAQYGGFQSTFHARLVTHVRAQNNQGIPGIGRSSHTSGKRRRKLRRQQPVCMTGSCLDLFDHIRQALNRSHPFKHLRKIRPKAHAQDHKIIGKSADRELYCHCAQRLEHVGILTANRGAPHMLQVQHEMSSISDACSHKGRQGSHITGRHHQCFAVIVTGKSPGVSLIERHKSQRGVWRRFTQHDVKTCVRDIRTDNIREWGPHFCKIMPQLAQHKVHELQRTRITACPDCLLRSQHVRSERHRLLSRHKLAITDMAQPVHQLDESGSHHTKTHQGHNPAVIGNPITFGVLRE